MRGSDTFDFPRPLRKAKVLAGNAADAGAGAKAVAPKPADAKDSPKALIAAAWSS